MSRLICAGIVMGCMGMAHAQEALWASDSLTKVLATDRAPDAPGTLAFSGARGETVSSQAVVLLEAAAEGVASTLSDLRHADSEGLIPATTASLQWVRYIDVERNTGSIPEDELVALAPVSLPDPFWEAATIDIAAGRPQPLWIELDIPRDAAPGDYSGELRVTVGDRALTLPASLHVWDFEMPRERHLSVINWWALPGVGFERIEPFSDAYWELLESTCRFVVRHRQTTVWASLTQLVRDADDGGIDTSRLERWAQIAFDAGVDRIDFQPVGGSSEFITEHTSVVLPIEEGVLRKLAAVDRLIVEKSWQDRFYAGIIDEPFIHHEDSFRRAAAQMREAAPHIGLTQAVEGVYFDLDVYVPKLNHLHLWYPEFDRIRQETGAELWYYTCCIPAGRYPNRFLDQSLLKARVLHWINYRYQLDGFLHWGFNHFAGTEPYTEDGVSRGLPLGDRAIAYPGTQGFLGSLRFSAQRDGLQDFEYLWVLEQRLRALKARLGDDAHWLDPQQRPMELCRRVVESFHNYTRDDDVLFDTRRVIAEEIEALDREDFLFVQTTPHEGFAVPTAAPTNALVRGVVAPGAEVIVNGQVVPNVKPSGAFVHYMFGVGEATFETTVTARRGDWEETVVRTFHDGNVRQTPEECPPR